MANTTAAIMAIPSPLESIRLVGDEDKHATLLFFGETSTLPGEALQTLKDSVELAAGMLFPFSESVVDIKRLGSDVPPALVACLSGENLTQVRNLFMMNPEVNGYQNNVEQHPSFTPHVTLGYPDFTDEAIFRALMLQIYGVRFDRLSVWWNDERFDYDLGLPPSDKTMSDAVDNFLAKHAVDDPDALEHSGVKGMKWGVRRRVDPGTGLVLKSKHDVRTNLKTGSVKVTGGSRKERKALKNHLNDGGQLDLATGKKALQPRTGSADQIAQDRIASKIKAGGVNSLSNADIQAYTRRLQMSKDLNRVLAEQSAAEKAASQSFITKFVKKQGARQADRVINKAIDIAVEKALESSGVKLGKKNPELGSGLNEISKRLKPKKK